jgi:hypothetical protein
VEEEREMERGSVFESEKKMGGGREKESKRAKFCKLIV